MKEQQEIGKQVDEILKNYECDGQIDIWEWMEEKESQNMTREEALQRIVDNNFAGEYGFDLQILIDCMAAAREMILNSQFSEIPEGATNGDMIKAMFPNTSLYINEMSHTVWVGYEEMSFRIDWWDSPYRKGTGTADIKAIPLDKIKELREEVENKYDDLANSWDERGQGKNEMINEVLELLDKLIESEE